jgi:tripartite-type tricarboxylate transporter receptor subunit TctC
LNRRFFLFSLALLPAFARAQAFPSRAVRIVVPFPPGNLTDRLARVLAERLHAAWGQPVVVDNRPGAHGNLGAMEVVKAAPDGHTLFMGYVGTHAVNPSLYPDLPYDPVKDFAPVALVASVPNLLVVNPQLPARDVRDLVALAKAKPGALTFASIGSGTSTHMAAEQFKLAAGIELVHVPYKGIGAALVDVIAGRVDFMFGTVASAYPLVKAGKLRGLGVTTIERAAAAPEVPTFSEQGYAGFEQGAWFALYAPAGTPAPVIGALSAEVGRILRRPEVAESLGGQGITPLGGSPRELADFQRDEAARWARVVRQAGIKPE